MVRIHYKIQDSDGETYVIVVYSLFQFGSTLDNIRTNIVEPFWALMYPLITGILVDMWFDYDLQWAIGGMPNNVVDVLSDIQERAVFTWRSRYDASLQLVQTLPTVRETIFTGAGAGKEVDLTDSDVAAYVAQFANQSYVGGLWPVDKHSHGYGDLKYALQSFKG